tara:strand:- start:383 stop:847 length:465 start_codon:yes stop_codon:yes gene_type:complete
MKKFLVLNGPNLNLLGTREPDTYGSKSMEDIVKELNQFEKKEDVKVDWFQSNHEGYMIDRIHDSAKEDLCGLVINPGAWGHQSIALRDALLCVNLSFVEVHISNIYKRELFRQKTLLADLAVAVISGCGSIGYQFAIQTLLKKNMDDNKWILEK